MGYYTTAEIVKIVNKLIDRCGTRDPYKVAKELGGSIKIVSFVKYERVEGIEKREDDFAGEIEKLVKGK